MNISRQVHTAIIVQLLREYFEECNDCIGLLVNDEIDSITLEETLKELELDYANKIMEGVRDDIR